MKIENAFSLILSFHFIFSKGYLYVLNSNVNLDQFISFYSEMKDICQGLNKKGFTKLETPPNLMFTIFPYMNGKLLEMCRK